MHVDTHETKRPGARQAKTARPLIESPTLESVLADKNARLADLGSVAEALDAPLWTLFIPGLSDHPELLEREGIQRIQSLVQNYLASDERGRHGIDVLAGHYAQK